MENTIADRREFYNESVNINNIGIETFPDVIVARLFAFGSRDLLEFEATEIADVECKRAVRHLKLPGQACTPGSNLKSRSCPGIDYLVLLAVMLGARLPDLLQFQNLSSISFRRWHRNVEDSLRAHRAGRD